MKKQGDITTRELLNVINKGFSTQKKYIDKRFDEVDQHFNQVDKHLSSVDKRFDKQDKEITRLGVSHEAFEYKVDLFIELSDIRHQDMIARINKLEQKLEKDIRELRKEIRDARKESQNQYIGLDKRVTVLEKKFV